MKYAHIKKLAGIPLIIAASLIVVACGTTGAIFGSNKKQQDELAVSRQAPLTVPPDFSLRPPKPGAPRPQEVDAQTQAIQAIFGPGAQVPPKSAAEQALLDRAGANNRISADIRSTLRDDGTEVVDKGVVVKDILDAPPGGAFEGAVVAIRKPGAQ
jgi:hypothetical protein